jgi:hypothetical protein
MKAIKMIMFVLLFFAIVGGVVCMAVPTGKKHHYPQGQRKTNGTNGIFTYEIATAKTYTLRCMSYYTVWRLPYPSKVLFLKVLSIICSCFFVWVIVGGLTFF